MSNTIAVMNLQSQNKALIAERDALEMENERLRDAISEVDRCLYSHGLTEEGPTRTLIREALKGGDA